MVSCTVFSKKWELTGGPGSCEGGGGPWLYVEGGGGWNAVGGRSVFLGSSHGSSASKTPSVSGGRVSSSSWS